MCNIATMKLIYTEQHNGFIVVSDGELVFHNQKGASNIAAHTDDLY